jgi:hypothetical protein
MPQDLWLPLLMIAACLFPLDVAVRRLMWGESEWRSLQDRVRSRKAQPGSTTSTQRDRSMDRLLQSKQRGTTSTQTSSTTQAAAATTSTPGTQPSAPSPAATLRGDAAQVPSPTATVPPPPPEAGAVSSAGADGEHGVSAPTRQGNITQEPPMAHTSPPSGTANAENIADDEAELDPMERLRRAKRRAHGEE